MTGTAPAGVLTVTVHGPAGALDLRVPAQASAGDVAAEYARQAAVGVPVLCTRLGQPLPTAVPLVEAGVEPGAVLVATEAGDQGRDLRADPGRARVPVQRRPAAAGGVTGGGAAAVSCSVAAAAAVAAGWAAARAAEPGLRAVVVVLLVAAAVVGVVPVGRHVRPRAAAAPAFAGAAAVVLARDPDPARSTGVVAVAALVAAATAGVAWTARRDEVLRVWVLAAGAVAVATALAWSASVDPQVAWAGLVAVGALATRWVPAAAVALPEEHLLDLDGVAAPAWTARDQRARASRLVVPPAAVARAAESAARTLLAASVAVAVVVPVAVLLLLDQTSGHGDLVDSVEHVGARAEVGLAGAVLLLASRDQRHRTVRRLLRVAGLGCWAVLARAVLTVGGTAWPAVVAAASVALGLATVAAAVVIGRGRRSVGWSRAADLAETAAGALLVGAVVVAAGGVRALWTVTG